MKQIRYRDLSPHSSPAGRNSRTKGCMGWTWLAVAERELSYETLLTSGPSISVGTAARQDTQHINDPCLGVALKTHAPVANA
jgi:hypothetical protein